MLNHRRRRIRRWTKAATAVVKDRHGYAANAWPLSQPSTPQDLAQLATDVQAWLSTQIIDIATPYGFSQCWILLALRREGEHRQLWYENLRAFSRQETQAALQDAQQHLLSLPLADYPTATRLEVYLISLGDIFKRAADTLEAH